MESRHDNHNEIEAIAYYGKNQESKKTNSSYHDDGQNSEWLPQQQDEPRLKSPWSNTTRTASSWQDDHDDNDHETFSDNNIEQHRNHHNSNDVTNVAAAAASASARGVMMDELDPTTGAAESSSSKSSPPSSSALLDSYNAAMDAEFLREATGGALSAPPPPGFEGPEERSRLVHELVFNAHHHHHYDSSHHPITTIGGGTSGGGGGNSYRNNNAIGKPPQQQLVMGAGSGGTYSSLMAASVLGSGLVESMNDSTFLDNQHHPNTANSSSLAALDSNHHQRGGGGGPWNNNNETSSSSMLFHSSQDLSYARHYRHAASRLIGTSPPRGEMISRMAGAGTGGGFFSSTSGTKPQEPPSSLLQSWASTVASTATTNTATSTPRISSSRNKHKLGVHGGGGDGDGGNFTFPAAVKSSRTGTLPSSFYEFSSSSSQPALDEDYSSMMMGARTSSLLDDDSRLPSTRDVGLTVIEPTDLFGRSVPTSSLARALFQQQHQQQQAVENKSGHRQVEQKLEQQQQQQYYYPQQQEETFGMQNLSCGGAPAGGAAGFETRATRVIRPPTMEQAVNTANQASRNMVFLEADLQPFLWEPILEGGGGESSRQSRCLAILQATSLTTADVRSTCEAFGVLETFRADFADRGIYFVSYYDIRNAQDAALELQPCLNGMLSSSPTDVDVEDVDILVFYCVPLNSSTLNDESILILTGLPHEEIFESIFSMLSAYGSIRRLEPQRGNYGGTSWVAEFDDVQEAKQALLELETTQPWGTDVSVEVGARSPIDRKKGRELLALIGRWRQSRNANRWGTDQQHPSERPHGNAATSMRGSVVGTSSSSSGGVVSTSNPSPATNLGTDRDNSGSIGGSGGGGGGGVDDSGGRQPPHPTTQLVLGPDGRYSYVVLNSYSPPPFGTNAGMPQHVMHIPHPPQPYATLISIPPQGSTIGVTSHTAAATAAATSQPYWSHHQPPHFHQYLPPGSTMISTPPFDGVAPPFSGASSTSLYMSSSGRTDVQQSSMASSSKNTAPSTTAVSVSEDKDNRHLMLDLDAVESGRDTRTSLMVRNIPNKYTQQMLLAEFADIGHGPGKIDFFYLPIDFKNRCNRGYAFINFVDYRDILSFHRQYFGKHWRAFNSDKICDVTYARIQGKAGMLKRFENSALMEKDEEYKPLVFVSHGENKGQRIPFPTKASATDPVVVNK